jgi:uncharacterized protein (DUF58 family)
MDQPPSLTPSVVAAIEDLELAARVVVEGLRAGAHRSPFHGFSADFQQHRSYRAGDDLKYLDWKLLARTDRLYSKQFRETTSMSVLLVLDTSGSMNFPRAGVSKFRYAQIVCASIAHLVSTQGDAVGLLAAHGDRPLYVAPRGGRHHLRSVIAQIDRLVTRAAWQPAQIVARASDLLKRRGALIVLSDFYDDEDAARRELRRAARWGHDVSMLQLTSPAERQMAFSGDVEFEDLESGTRCILNAASAARQYRADVDAFLERCHAEARRDGVDYALLSTDEPIDQALRAFLLKRASVSTVGRATAVR